jgi:RHS repeat-associated protein
VARFSYDSLDMLVAVSWSGRDEVWTAGYDGLRRRLYKALGGARTDFYWDGDRLAAEIGPTGALRLYVYPGPGSLVPMMFVDYDRLGAAPDSGRTYYVFGDQVGVPLHIEDREGNIVWRAERVDPYGAITVAAGNAVSYAPRFPGHYFDEETGLHDNRHRTYSPRLGRYLQSDPAGQSGGINLYAYPANPLVDVDVLGLTPACQSDKPPVNPNDEVEKPPSPHEEPPIKDEPPAPYTQDKTKILFSFAMKKGGHPFSQWLRNKLMKDLNYFSTRSVYLDTVASRDHPTEHFDVMPDPKTHKDGITYVAPDTRNVASEGFVTIGAMNKGWNEAFTKAMSEADTMLFILTPEYKESQWCMLEWKQFQDENAKRKAEGRPPLSGLVVGFGSPDEPGAFAGGHADTTTVPKVPTSGGHPTALGPGGTGEALSEEGYQEILKWVKSHLYDDTAPASSDSGQHDPPIAQALNGSGPNIVPPQDVKNPTYYTTST